MSDWISEYLDYTSESEAPEHFHKWTALSAIAGLLQRKVWIEFGYHNIYPNLYILLVAPPAGRKSSALNFGREILTSVQSVKLSDDAATIQSIAKDLADISQTFDYDKKIYLHSSMTIQSGEFGTLFEAGDSGLMDRWFTDWYDCKSPWTYGTKNKGKSAITGICVNLIGGTTPDWISQFLPMSAVGGGFTSRIIFVWGDQIRKPIPWPEVNHELKFKKKELLAGATKMASLSGVCKLTKEARALVDKWYIDHTNGAPTILDKRFHGYLGRKHFHILKLSMCLAIGRTSKLTVDKQHIEEAITLLNQAEPGFIRSFGGLGRNALAQLVQEIMDFIEKKKEVTRQELLEANWRNATLDDMDKSLAALEEMKYIKTIIGKGVRYRWIKGSC